jgi:hypothetical protein
MTVRRILPPVVQRIRAQSLGKFGSKESGLRAELKIWGPMHARNEGTAAYVSQRSRERIFLFTSLHWKKNT